MLAQRIMSELQMLDTELQGLIYIARFGVLLQSDESFALILPFGNKKKLTCPLLFKRPQLRDVGFLNQTLDF